MYYDQQGVLPGPDGGLALTPETKRRMITLPIEDRRHGTDELAEVHVPLKAAGKGYLWADAKDVRVALQSGPSRIDGACRRQGSSSRQWATLADQRRTFFYPSG
jgi:hypothetical protein